MLMRPKGAEAGVVRPADLAMLGRVFDATARSGETDEERENRAGTILRHFEEGISDEITLVSLVTASLRASKRPL